MSKQEMGLTKAYVKLDEQDAEGKNIGLKKFFRLGEGAKTKIFCIITPPNREEPIVKVEAHSISRALEVIGNGVFLEDELLQRVPVPEDNRDYTEENIFELHQYDKIDKFAES